MVLKNKCDRLKTTEFCLCSQQQGKQGEQGEQGEQGGKK